MPNGLSRRSLIASLAATPVALSSGLSWAQARAR